MVLVMQSDMTVQPQRAGSVAKTMNKDFAVPLPKIQEETFAKQKCAAQTQDKPVNISCRLCLSHAMPLLHLAAALVCARESR